MLAAQVGDLVDNVIDLVRAHDLGKIVEGTQLRKGIDSDVGYPAQKGIGEAGVDFVWETNIVGENLENVVCETSAQLVGPSGARSPRPVGGYVLRSGMNLGAELRQEFEEVHAHDGVI